MAMPLKDEMNWILSGAWAMSRSTEQHSSSPCQQARRKHSETSCQMHLITSLACSDRRTHREWHPSLWYAPISRFPARGSETLAKWPAGCEHLGGCAVQRAIWHGLQDLPFLCANYSGHSDKSRGKWRSTCVWNSLNFITNHQGLTQGQAVWLWAQPRFHFRLIKVHSLPLASLEGCDISARRSKNTAPTVTLDWTSTNGVAATASLLWCALPRYFCCS